MLYRKKQLFLMVKTQSKNNFLKSFSAVFAVLAFVFSTIVVAKSDAVEEEKMLPERAAPLIEVGGRFLDTGPIGEQWELFTGAFWQPRLWLIGNYRTALQFSDSGADSYHGEWVHQLNLGFNLQLSGTERLFLEINPLNQNSQHTGIEFKPAEKGWRTHLDGNISSLFFEGDLGEVFPFLNSNDEGGGDVGFSVGRQRLTLQEGYLMNDILDMVGVTQNSILIPGSSNFLITGFWAWSEVNRFNRDEDEDAMLFGVHARMDRPIATWDFDAIAIVDEDDVPHYVAGLSAISRIGHYGLALRALGSLVTDDHDFADTGLLLAFQSNVTPNGSDDLLYLNGFWQIGEYTPGSLDNISPGPLAQTGILFAANAIGRIAPLLSGDVEKGFGAALGYEWLINRNTQTWLELGFRIFEEDQPYWQVGLVNRWQFATSDRSVFIVDAGVEKTDEEETAWLARAEWLIKF